MATPIKSLRVLLSPHVVSPLSPTVRHRLGSSKVVARSLNFSPVKQSSLCKVVEASVKITVIPCDNKEPTETSLLVNTPNKLDILRNGLNCRRNLNVLGKGTFGTVVRGRYKGEDVAVKVVKSKQNLKESNALKLLHGNVIGIKDIIENENNSIVIMEYLGPGRQLQSLLDDDRVELDFKKVLRIASDIGSGLSYCHQKGVLHLDLKPSNVIVGSDGRCKICDFGNSCVYGKEENFTHEGTVPYTAPEILLGNRPVFASDTYSLGIILWQLRYRELPYASIRSREIIIYKVVKYTLRPISSRSNEIEDHYCDLYKSCWVEDAEKRPMLATVISSLSKL